MRCWNWTITTSKKIAFSCCSYIHSWVLVPECTFTVVALSCFLHNTENASHILGQIRDRDTHFWSSFSLCHLCNTALAPLCPGQKWGCFYVQQSHNFHIKVTAPPLGSPVSSHIPRKCKLFFIRKRNSPVTMYYSCPSCKKVPVFIFHRSRDFHSTPEISWAISTEVDYSGSALC